MSVRDQYEAYPYPARDPADEKKRLVQGSPSLPTEIDHFLFDGSRDWTRPLRVLVAGGGTGDGLIQLATLLTKANRPYQIVYVDLSTSSRKIAEERAQIRQLTDITFLTGSLLDAAKLGQFDYIDCCGVLHHLPDPDAGFHALRSALAPGGGIGFMVYAPYGRSGVYPLQDAYNALFSQLSPEEKLAAAKSVQEKLPAGHPFANNPNLGDHKASDAGFYDLLLHSQDRSYDVVQLTDALTRADLSLVSFATPGLYQLQRFAPRPAGMDDITAMAIAEKLNGTIKTHVAYAVPISEARNPARPNGSKRPHIRGPITKIAQVVAKTGMLALQGQDPRITLNIPRAAAPLLARANGQFTLDQIRAKSGLDPIQFTMLWTQVDKALTPWGLLHYSNIIASF
ncbi:class I SAM-dependent methyltransferase [Aestuariibius sp. HNIBRBA575]|uniref:class I SAM-dependent methyltransferase n=1 Tax=Aestuariibius sp. HNIBRBA575 TaxID=3233343 RepID=UPI0034A509C4